LDLHLHGLRFVFLKDDAASEAELEELAKKVEAVAREHHVRGSYIIATVDDKGFDHTYAKSDYIYSYYFNYFHD